MTAVNPGKRILFEPFSDAERNLQTRKAIGFNATVATVTGGTLSVANNTQSIALTATTTAAKDWGSASFSAGAFTVPFGGLWEFVGQATLSASAGGGRREVNIFNSTTSTVLGQQTADGSANVIYSVNVTALAHCSTGDVIQLRVFQDSGGALTASNVGFGAVFHGQTGKAGGATSL